MLKFVINLDKSTERLQNIKKQLDDLNISFERISAIKGREIDADIKNQVTYPINHFDTKFRFTRALTDGEIGCFLSHRECWKKLIASNEQFSLIMEDDIIISKKAKPYISSPNWIPTGVDICQLSCLEKKVTERIRNQILPIDQTIKLVSPLFPQPLGTQCYIISRKAAEVALSLSTKLPAPVDNFLFSLWFDMANQFTTWRTSPTLAIPETNIKSDIGGRKNHIKKAPFLIRHGLRRFLMDMKIKKIQRSGIPFIFKFE